MRYPRLDDGGLCCLGGFLLGVQAMELAARGNCGVAQTESDSNTYAGYL